MSARHAYVLQVGARYFAKLSKAGRVQTSWCLAGAALFQAGGGIDYRDPDMLKVVARLEAKGKSVRAVRIGPAE